ncbi:hypothetical protein RM11_1093 [Bartonella quintana RM-11]|nr:hypothetical protein RM11_1093 [Bartonella quintana RM-11]
MIIDVSSSLLRIFTCFFDHFKQEKRIITPGRFFQRKETYSRFSSPHQNLQNRFLLVVGGIAVLVGEKLKTDIQHLEQLYAMCII